MASKQAAARASRPIGPSFDASILRNLAANQSAFLRDLSELVSGVAKRPTTWPNKVVAFWSRWAAPSAWSPWSRRAIPDMDQPPAIYFVIDPAGEATPEREIAVRAATPDTRVVTTALKNVLGSGEISPSCVEAHITSAGDETKLRVALVNLRGLRKRSRTASIDPGLYVGAVVSDDDKQNPISVVQVLVVAS